MNLKKHYNWAFIILFFLFNLSFCSFKNEVQLNPRDPFIGLTEGPDQLYFTRYLPYKNLSDKKYTVDLPDQYPVWGLTAKRNNGQYSLKSWEQNLINAKSNKGVWKEDNKTYFLKPDYQPSEASINTYDYTTKFPDFTIPANKILINQCNFFSDKYTDRQLKKGSTFIRPENANGNQAISYKFIGDSWLWNLGMPAPYNSTQEAFDTWAKNLDPEALLNAFKAEFEPYKNYGYLEWNAEDCISRWYVDRWKIERCFEWWNSQEHTAKLGAWFHKPVSISKVNYTSAPFNLVWNNEDNLRKQGVNKNLSTFHKSLDIWQVGGYFNKFDDCFSVHHYLIEYLLNKKIDPSKKVLLTQFASMESQVDNYLESNLKPVIADDGTEVYLTMKPEVFPNEMFNMGAWAMAVGDGLSLWEDPIWYLENDNNHYSGWSQKKQTNLTNYLKDEWALDLKRNRKNVDWLMAGVWSISENKDIINYNSQWQWGTMPDEAATNRELMWAYKKTNDSMLILALDSPYCKEKENTHTITIDGKPITIKTYGSWTSIIRIGL